MVDISILRRDSIINITRMSLSSKYVKLKKDISTTIHALTYEQALYILCASHRENVKSRNMDWPKWRSYYRNIHNFCTSLISMKYRTNLEYSDIVECTTHTNTRGKSLIIDHLLVFYTRTNVYQYQLIYPIFHRIKIIFYHKILNLCVFCRTIEAKFQASPRFDLSRFRSSVATELILPLTESRIL